VKNVQPQIIWFTNAPKAFTDDAHALLPGLHARRGTSSDRRNPRRNGVIEKTIGVAPVGCSVFAYNYFDTDFVEAPHGRAPAMATGIKRVLPDRIVFTYQGDGDLASIGMGEIVHAAARGENITVIFINNANYGMTGGQMAPTTLPGMKTTSSPNGRDVEIAGLPHPHG
jgi:2-oxoglutarate/2-oxoacid ferredoxin oxidoreductase subunit beta